MLRKCSENEKILNGDCRQTAKMKPIMTTERTELHKNINIIKIDPALENATLAG